VWPREGKVKEQWGKLTDDDLDRIPGKRDQARRQDPELLRHWQDEAEKQLNDWESRQTEIKQPLGSRHPPAKNTKPRRARGILHFRRTIRMSLQGP
jgi:uncharacterized protein YjbJ (UPF0337 family)